MNRQIVIFFLIIIGLVGVVQGALAQQRPVQSLYMFDLLLVNPAYAGRDVQVSATAINRNQWVNFEGAPKTSALSVHSSFFSNIVGVGLLVTNDNIGIHNDFSAYGIYSYRLRLARNHYLSTGVQAGFNNLVSDFDLLNNKSPDANLSGTNRVTKPNVGVGFYYTFKDLYAGISAPYLINNEVIDLENVTTTVKQRRYYYIMGGYSYDVSPVVRVKPNALIRMQEGSALSIDLNTNVFLYQVVGLGMSYRSVEGFVAMFELKFTDNFHFGYAYDITTSDIRKYSNGSHEFMLNYRFKIRKAHEGVPCPTYFK